MEIKVKRESLDVKLPTKKTDGSLGYDIYANESWLFRSGQIKMLGTGLSFELPANVYCDVRTRSGMATKGICVFNSPGTIDNDYRGEIKVILYYAGLGEYQVNKGDRIAQLVFHKKEDNNFTFEIVDDLNETARGIGGFGSTGK